MPPAARVGILLLALLLAGCAANPNAAPSTSTPATTSSTVTSATPATASTAAAPSPSGAACPPPPPGAPPPPAGQCPPPPSGARPPPASSTPPPAPVSSTPPPSSSPVAPTATSGSTSNPSSTTGGASPEARFAALRNAFACVDAPLAVTDHTSNAKMTCTVSLSASGGDAVVTASGIPNHDYESGGACCAKAGTHTYSIPLAPANDTDGTLTSAATRGAIAVAINGAAIFGPEDGDSRDVVAYTLGTCTACSSGPTVNFCMGHATPDGTYHYHADANCVRWSPAVGQAWNAYAWDTTSAAAHSKIIGFAFDGYPIYGTFGYGPDGGVKEMTSSYSLKSGKSGAGGIADYDYIAGLGDLDACNGKWTVTPEYPEGTYAYFSTRHNGLGANGFPYFLNCYHGVFDTANQQATGGMMPTQR